MHAPDVRPVRPSQCRDAIDDKCVLLIALEIVLLWEKVISVN